MIMACPGRFRKAGLAKESGSVINLLTLLVAGLRALAAKQTALTAENLALRQQLAIYRRTVTRPRLRRCDRVFWVWLSWLWSIGKGFVSTGAGSRGAGSAVGRASTVRFKR
jgi:hypothetical protein